MKLKVGPAKVFTNLLAPPTKVGQVRVRTSWYLHPFQLRSPLVRPTPKIQHRMLNTVRGSVIAGCATQTDLNTSSRADLLTATVFYQFQQNFPNPNGILPVLIKTGFKTTAS